MLTYVVYHLQSKYLTYFKANNIEEATIIVTEFFNDGWDAIYKLED